MHTQHTDDQSPAQVWEERYASKDQLWSGKVNHSMAQVADTLTPGRSLDLGCGEGGDVAWLAQQGWHALGFDLSPTAISRAQAACTERGITGADFEARDLTDLALEPTFDLITASFFHSMVELARTDILRAAADGVRAGGHLLIVSHAAAPPWADAAAHEHHFLTPEEEVAELALPAAHWSTQICEVRRRPATGPQGEESYLDDVVVLLKRN